MARFLLINNTQGDIPLRDSRKVPAQHILAVEQINFEMRRLERAGMITIKDQTVAAALAKDANLQPLFVDVLPLPSTVSTVASAASPAAGGSDTNFVFTQPTAEAVWEITHNLGKFPSVVVVDSSDDEVEGRITYLSNNQIVITFSAPFSGRALLN